MLINMKCPQCGAALTMDDKQQQMFCRYCGAQIANIPQRYEVNQNVNIGGTVTHRADNSGLPNLHIHYSSINISVGMVVRIVLTGQKSYFMNGQSMSFHLPYGAQNLVLKIGKKNYARTVFLPADNTPVTIYASWNGRAHIAIDQPPYQQPMTRPVTPMPNVTPNHMPSMPNVLPPSGMPAMPQPTPQPRTPNVQNMPTAPAAPAPNTPAAPTTPIMQNTSAAPNPAAEANICPSCGHTSPASTNFCTNCGAKIFS